MGCKNVCAVLFVVLGLAGCAAPKQGGSSLGPPDTVWQDAVFNYQRSLVTETPATVFALDPEVLSNLRLDDGVTRSKGRRLDLLLTRLYGPNGIRVSYASGHTTKASETWHNQRGDCLSLTILAYASARYLGIDAHMQEVQVPAAVDRRDGVDFINEHVNVVVRHSGELTIDGKSYGAGGLIIDFEPQVGTRRLGEQLSENGIMARFYNNRATEFLVQKDDVRAYAYYRAAIETAPEFAPAYSNLAQLYAAHGLLADAERLLRQALAQGGPSYAPLRTMRTLMLTQRRNAEAKHYEDLLAKRQDEDPYYWMGLGMAALGEGRNSAAIRALERAETLTTGFEELHFYLGVAYWRGGQLAAASKQLAAMNALNNTNPGVALLTKKLQGMAPRTAVY